MIPDMVRPPSPDDLERLLLGAPRAYTRGDVFGTPTNLVARLTAMAGRNSVLADSVTAEALADHPDFALRALPAGKVRGLGVVAPYEVARRVKTPPP
jgi:class 3 adenylate cyclase